MPVIEIKEQCKICKGTGLTITPAEKDGAAIVCYMCRGSGWRIFRHEYEEFTSRKELPGVRRVFAISNGFILADTDEHRLEDFGGLSYEDWKAGKEFGPGTEDRINTCPHWWYHHVAPSKQPNWKECHPHIGVAAFRCRYFGNKDKCWERWDAEFASSEQSSNVEVENN